MYSTSALRTDLSRRKRVMQTMLWRKQGLGRVVISEH